MNRAKFVASAFIGVVVAANSCEHAQGQSPSRFIVQPQRPKQVVAPEPAATPIVPQTGTVETPVQSAALPVQSPVPTTAPATTQLESIELSQPIAPLPINASTATTGAIDIKVDSLDAFPSLKPATKAELSFDSLESLATVDSKEFEAEVAKFAATFERAAPQPELPKLNSPDQASPVEHETNTRTAQERPMVSGHRTSPSSQLQWTARPSGSRIPPMTTRSHEDSAASQHLSSRYTPATNNQNAFNSFQANSLANDTHSFNMRNDDARALQAAQEQAVANNQLLTKIADRVEAIESKIIKNEEPEERARTRAALVSSRITNDPRFATEDASELNVSRLESPQGWQAIGQRLTNHVKTCESLLRRGAFCSAREEAENACVLLIRHIDLIDNLYRCEPAWLAAKQSLSEAEDFLAVQRASDSDGLQRLIDSHHTPILKGKNLAEMSPLTAAQHYRLYAELQLVEATQGHPWASELLYAVGRTYQSEADADRSQVDAMRMKALAYYRAARTTLPTNSVACNQLGHLLLQMDRNDEAREVLAAAVTLTNDVASLSNLAEASRRLGDTQTVAWAAQSVAAIRSRTPQQAQVPPYVDLTAEEFMAISPRSIGPKPETESMNSGQTAPVHKSAAAPRASQFR